MKWLDLVAQPIQTSNFRESISKISIDELWQIYEENKQLSNLWELIEPLEEQRIKEEQERTQANSSNLVG